MSPTFFLMYESGARKTRWNGTEIYVRRAIQRKGLKSRPFIGTRRRRFKCVEERIDVASDRALVESEHGCNPCYRRAIAYAILFRFPNWRNWDDISEHKTHAEPSKRGLVRLRPCS